MAEAEHSKDAARPMRRGGRVVPSRYLSYGSKASGKATKSKREAPARRLSTETTGGLQSTMVEISACCRPDLEISAIKDKSCLKTPASKPSANCSLQRSQNSDPSDPETLLSCLESQTLLLTFAYIKMEKNLALLEEKSEGHLLVLCEETRKLQEGVYQNKLQLARLRREREISETLDRQMEVLWPVSELCSKFGQEYKRFATALDATRHELPAKEIYLGDEQSQYLDTLQKRLSDTQNILHRILPEHAEANAKAVTVAKELEESALKLHGELKRTFGQVLDLSGQVSKETSLQCQQACEDSMDPEHVKKIYFH